MSIFDMLLTKAMMGEGGGGGGSSDLFIIDITDDSGTITTNITAEDIWNARNAGKLIFLREKENESDYYMFSFDSVNSAYYADDDYFLIFTTSAINHATYNNYSSNITGITEYAYTLSSNDGWTSHYTTKTF